ncbi:TolC family protein [Sphingobacterium daejeonense]|uniref:TolC family protein n=1 Tax=Sphingobacterium daejeonense TaxID=371142 RepID=UPI0010C4D0F5|nr:TolC family protein [Sphingobacterium daejeonense]VTP91680.1 Outer membrane protein oprM precursor [Sphingobacterium daejeonense]
MKTIKDIRPAVIGGILFSAFLASCSVQKYSRPEVELPQAYRNSEQSADTVNIASIGYREFFRDPVLVALIDSGVRNNNDLKVALKQIEYASLGYTQSKWANVPTVSATIAGATLTRPSDNSLNGQSLGYFVGQKHIGDFTTSVNIGWEADIWGKDKGRKGRSADGSAADTGSCQSGADQGGVRNRFRIL